MVSLPNNDLRRKIVGLTVKSFMPLDPSTSGFLGIPVNNLAVCYITEFVEDFSSRVLNAPPRLHPSPVNPQKDCCGDTCPLLALSQL